MPRFLFRGDDVKITLRRASERDAERLWEMQVEAFSEMYKKYGDCETSPAAEPLEKMLLRLNQPFTYFYFIDFGGTDVGAIRVVDKGNGPKRISPVFVMPSYRNRGIAQSAITEAERLHGASGWELETVLEEASCRHLYEKLGYHRTGETRRITPAMTLVIYRKD